MFRHSLLLLAAVLMLGSACAHAAPPAQPATPRVYDVQIRYRIRAYRTQRLQQYAEMMRHLKALGFERAADEDIAENEPDDPEATRMRGTIPAANASRLLHERHIRAILLLPHGVALPVDKNTRVRVEMQLASGMTPPLQHRLSQQVQAVLKPLRFQEAVAYDHHGYTRLLGSLPAGQLEKVLAGLRYLPGGGEQTAPFSQVTAVRILAVRPDWPVPSPLPPPPVVARGQEKVTSDLRQLLTDAGQAAKPMRLELLLADAPSAQDANWWRDLTRAVPGVTVEGQLGPLVTVFGRPDKIVLPLAALPEVVAVRLPLPAREAFQTGARDLRLPDIRSPKPETRNPKTTNRKLQTVLPRVVVVDGDFRGWKELVGTQLPRTTRLIDLTRERNPSMEPDPFPTGTGLGTGTRHALALLRQAPPVDLTLVRIDPAAPYMLQEMARAINGEAYRSIGQEQRVAELDAEKEDLARRQERLLAEQREAFADLDEEGEAAKKRQEYQKHQAALEREQRDAAERTRRYLQMVQDMNDLRGVRFVASGLVWNEGFPVNGASALSRYFDDRPFKAALWFQAAGDTRGQAWVGPFRDVDQNEVMEFAAPTTPLPEDTWTPELNFLSWQPKNGPVRPDLPANVRLRVSLQWQEAHDPALRGGEDVYRVPLAQLVLQVLYQPDPTGTKRPGDDLEVVAQSAGLPQRLEQTAFSATYEQTVEFTARRPGRYALRIVGRPPQGLRPTSMPTLPTQRQYSELRLRLFVGTRTGAGRALLHDFTTAEGSIGMPADAHQVITVGAADARGQPEPYSAVGPPYNLLLLPKPDVWMPDQGQGSAWSASEAAGLAATLPWIGHSRTECLRAMHR